jgi:hypothetical protein
MTPISASRDLSRRTFLQSAAAAAALAVLSERRLYGGAPDIPPAPRSDGTAEITFFEPVDVLICGSTLFACQLALDATRSGLRTLLVMDRVNPFLEGVACLRSWVDAADRARVPELIRGVIDNATTTETKEGRTYFNAMRAVLDIEDQLCAAGVRFFYNASVAGALGHEGRLGGVVFGGKTGLFAVEARAVVDATLEATVARAAGARFTSLPGPRRYHYLAELGKPAPARRARYRASNGVQVSVDIHHYYAAFDLVLNSQTSGPFALAEDYAQIYAASLECPWDAAEQRFRGADAFLTNGADRLEAKSGHVEGLDNLLVFGPQGITDNRQGSLVLQNLDALFAAFPAAIEMTKAVMLPIAQPRPLYEFWNRGVPAEKAPDTKLVHSFRDHGFDEPDTVVAAVRFQPPEVSVSTQAIIVGGGTSGNAAAYSASSLGFKTVCLERGLELGGTNTVGGVPKLWYGNETRAFDDYYRAMGAKNDGINAPGFFRGVTKAGCRVVFQSPVTGVACAGRQLRRVYVTTPFGLTAVAADHWIDATGDGAIAAWAGCGYTYGGEHDELTLWASFAGFRPGNPEAMRPFLSPLDERSPLDVTRFILAMRRNGRTKLHEGKHFPPPFFVAPRESRHIRGGKTLTFLDVLAGRRFRDGILRAESNPDIKGVATSDAAKAGFIPLYWERVLQVTVPYAALIPTALDNVIVAGKAYSVTHDALATARMQRDLCVMGLVVGEALRLAIDRKVLLRDIPVAQLQATLFAKGMLKPEDIAADDLGFGHTPAEIARKVIDTGDMDECLTASAMLCLLPPAQARALLEPHAGLDLHAVNRVLGFLGSPQGCDGLAHHVARALNEPELSKELFGGAGNKLSMPDQGYAPWTALRLHCLSQVRDRRAVALLARLSERVSFEPKDMNSSWGYFYSLACGFERLACAEARAPLQRVLQAPLFQGRLIARGADLRACRDTQAERFGYLRLALARALTRCGDPAGAMALCEFLNEARVCYARAARATLVAVTGKDYGFRAVEWRDWISRSGGNLKPVPLMTPFS